MRDHWACISYTVSDDRWHVSNVRSSTKSTFVERGRSEGARPNIASTHHRAHPSHARQHHVFQRPGIQRFLVAAGIPFLALSTSALFGGSSASAASYMAPGSILSGLSKFKISDKIQHLQPSFLIPDPKKVQEIADSTIGFAKETMENIDSLAAAGVAILEFFQNIPSTLAQTSIDLLMWSYDMIATIVLRTPTYLFSGEWFAGSVLTFTGMSIMMMILLSIYEGFRRMMNPMQERPSYRPTELKKLVQRAPAVLVGSALAPMGFTYGAKVLNWISEMIISVGRYRIASVSIEGMGALGFFEVLALVGFNIGIVYMMVPVFMQNFRRWFDLVALGVMTPLALTCWMFEGQRHYFHAWWEHIKRCSTVQVAYSIFLLLIGALMFGTPMPSSFSGIILKMGIVLGGFWRMSDPPAIMRRNFDTGRDLKGMIDGAKETLKPNRKTKEAWSMAKTAGNLVPGAKLVKKANPFKKK